ncbi:MAG: hypothetical protein EHM33_31585 [Chloroflexi bacterium]|nr:MAG: hypothetical protein EHM33_31585 [Chloroflexota bacterium]
MDEKHHEMILEKTHISGVEEWYCPTCGRRFMVQWPPAYKMVIVEPGEKDIRHNVSKANSRIGPRQVTQTEETEPIDEFRLIPWLKWMEKVDFDSRWSKNV